MRTTSGFFGTAMNDSYFSKGECVNKIKGKYYKKIHRMTPQFVINTFFDMNVNNKRRVNRTRP